MSGPCCVPPDAQPGIEWRFASASKSKFGFSELNGMVSTPPQFFSTRTLKGQRSGPSHCSSDDYNCTQVETIDPASGAFSFTGDNPCGYDPCKGEIGETGTIATNVESSGSCVGGCLVTGDTSISGSEVLSGEYTTAKLIDDAKGLLPAYSGDWIEGATAFTNMASRFLNDDEDVYEITQSQWRVEHPPSPSCYLKAWIQMVFLPSTVGADPVLTDLGTYEWSGTPADPSKAYDDASNYIHGSIANLAIPATNGQAYIQIVKFSYIPTYEPVDNSKSGWPQT